jgi:hypothetical protein
MMYARHRQAQPPICRNLAFISAWTLTLTAKPHRSGLPYGLANSPQHASPCKYHGILAMLAAGPAIHSAHSVASLSSSQNTFLIGMLHAELIAYLNIWQFQILVLPSDSRMMVWPT